MANDKFYNAEIKQRYFETIANETVREITEYAFMKAKDTEVMLNKDMYEMDIDELAMVIKGMGVSTDNSAKSQAFKIQYYIDWASANGLRKTNINPLKNVDKKDWVKPLVARYKQSLFTREEILDMCEELVNYSDRAVLLGLFEGISGEGYSELLNLKAQDIVEIDGQFHAKLTDKDGKERTIKISDTLAKYMFLTNETNVYYDKNGKSESTRLKESPLLESEFIFKKAARGRKDTPINQFYIHRKFSLFKEVFGITHLRPKEVINSGILHMVNKAHEEKGYISDEDYIAIADQFDTTMSQYNGREYRILSTLKDLANSQIFEDKYGYKVKVMA